jgi:hypothetical protein
MCPNGIENVLINGETCVSEHANVPCRSNHGRRLAQLTEPILHFKWGKSRVENARSLILGAQPKKMLVKHWVSSSSRIEESCIEVSISQQHRNRTS